MHVYFEGTRSENVEIGGSDETNQLLQFSVTVELSISCPR